MQLEVSFFAAVIATLSVVSTAAAHDAAIKSAVVAIDGWYNCSASTLWPSGGVVHGDDYYLETKATKGKAKGKVRSAAHRTTDTGKWHPPARYPAWRAPFLRDPLAGVQPSSSYGKPPHGHAHYSKNKKTHDAMATSELLIDMSVPQFECAEFRVPFCYEGICESDRTMDVFVKRVVATTHTSESEQPAKSLWVLQGGPGASSTAMEGLMGTMYDELDRAVSIYTMDHRGTARSNRLECQAAEAQTPGSPGGTFVVMDEIPSCINDILFQIDNQTAAFSVTSAAMDLRTIIDHSLADQDVYVYGLSYGTYLVERLIHFAPQSVRGFIIDGIVSEAGATVEERSTYSNWDYDVGKVGERFFGYCEADPFCSSHFHHKHGNLSLAEDVMALYKQLDAAVKDSKTNNACANVLKQTMQRPSYFLRSVFSQLITDEMARAVIPAVVFRLMRCAKPDVDALQFFVDFWTQPLPSDGDQPADLDDVLFTSQMLYSLIVFSEMWESPSPDKNQLIQWYEDAIMGSENFASFPYYCLFTGSREKGCKALTHLPQSKPMMYARDKYWNQTVELPRNTSALLLSGGLDIQTRRMYGDLEYESLTGDRMLVQFDYAGHCTTFTTPTKSGGRTCGVQILASYVRNNGLLMDVDTSCVGDVYDLDFAGAEDTAQAYFGTSHLYG